MFDGEYLTKKTKEELEYYDHLNILSNIILNKKSLLYTNFKNREYIILKENIDKYNVVNNMRNYFYKHN